MMEMMEQEAQGGQQCTKTIGLWNTLPIQVVQA